jgi:protein TonB
MSSRRLVFCSVVWALATTAAATAQLPSGEIGPVEKQAKRITPENPIPRRFHAVDPIYPPEAVAIGATARVNVRAVLDQFGRVVEVRRTNLPIVSSSMRPAPDAEAAKAATEALLRSAVDAVRQWQYDPPADGPIAFTVSFNFAPGRPVSMMTPSVGGVAETVTVVGGVGPPPPPPPPPPPAAAPGSPTGTAVPSAAAASSGPVRVGSGIQAPQMIRRVSPVYPPAAEAARVQGVVILEAVIGTDGRVMDARILRSIPLLDQAAIDAVRQWQYLPTLLNGAAVPVIMTVTVQFTLASQPEQQPQP